MLKSNSLTVAEIKQRFMSDSIVEVNEVAEQLTAFGEAQRLREEVQTLKSVVKFQKDNGVVKHLPCPNCKEPLAPADVYNAHDEGWMWEADKAYECNNCGMASRVTVMSLDADVELQEIINEEYEICDD